MKKYILTILILIISTKAVAGEINVKMFRTTNDKSNGYINFKDTTFGLLITPNLINIPQGPHGFHVHMHHDCKEHGLSAGGHYDPQNTNTHRGPYVNGHLGDMPVLVANKDYKALIQTIAPRLTTKDLIGRTIMIHEGGDTYSDNPPLGGGGARISCGVVR